MTKPLPYRRVKAPLAATFRILRDLGLTVAQISQRTKVNVSTVRRWLNRAEDSPKPQTRGPRRVKSPLFKALRPTLLAVVRATCLREGVKRPMFSSLSQITRELNVRGVARKVLSPEKLLSRWTVGRYLKDLGFQSRVRPRVCTCDETDFAKRKAFAKVHSTRARGEKKVLAANIVFSDEKIFTCNDHTNRRMFVRPGVDRLLPRENRRWGPRIMVWAAIGVNFRHLYVLPKPKTARGTIDEQKLSVLTSESYRRLVLPKVKNHLQKERIVFMQDGAKPHTAKATYAYLRRMGIDLLENWPPRSPDLNPIENLWSIVERRVAAREVPPRTAAELIVAVTQEFKAVPVTTINNLVLGFNDRCARVAARDGRFE